jgi:hypothetical protein
MAAAKKKSASGKQKGKPAKPGKTGGTLPPQERYRSDDRSKAGARVVVE